jgi:hypothetical protein
MGEILGVGATHYPPGLVPEEYKPWPLVRMLQGDRIPEHMKDPANWPEPMRQESSALRQRLFSGERHAMRPPASWADPQRRGAEKRFVLPIPIRFLTCPLTLFLTHRARGMVEVIHTPSQ